MCVDAALMLSLVILSDEEAGAFPKAKLTLCSRSSSSVTERFRDSRIKRSNSGSAAGTFWNCFRSAIQYYRGLNHFL